MDLSATVVRYCDAVCKDAGRPVTSPQEMNRSEAKLNEARNVALAFGLDCQPIDVKIAWVKQVKGGDRTTKPGPALPP